MEAENDKMKSTEERIKTLLKEEKMTLSQRLRFILLQEMRGGIES